MKWLFLSLLLVNLGLAVWFSLDKDPVQARSGLKDVGDLKIVSDVELELRTRFKEEEKAQEKPKLPVVTADRSSVEPVSSATTAPDSDTAEVPAQKPAVVSHTGKSQGETDRCMFIGYFSDKKDASELARLLAGKRIAAKLKHLSKEKTTGYWAMIPARPTEEDADKVVENLLDQGLTDIRRFQTGENYNAISLGLFSKKLNAIKRIRTVEKLGYIALVKEKTETTTHYFLEFRYRKKKLPFADLIRKNYPDIEIKTCNGIASR